jgi:hydrogenase maturation protease
MSLELAKKVADAILYEGYLLYPYRASAVKNRQRFNFGVLLPPSYARAQSGNDAWSMRTECLLEGDAPRLDVRVRFLQVVTRQVGRLLEGRETDCGENDAPPNPMGTPLSSQYEIVSELEIDGEIFQTWQEAVERDAVALDLSVPELVDGSRHIRWNAAPAEETEALCDKQGRAAGVLVRRWERIECEVEIGVEQLEDGLWKIAIAAENQTPFQVGGTRDDALPYSLIAAHTLLTARGGEFISLLDPPQAFAAACGGCQNTGTWPVLVGGEGERGWMLSSPIILYDYPQIAPESDGDFFDGTEMDEMLALRVLTLTDDEKRQMRNVDRRAREILERTESMPQERFLNLHGTIRGLKQCGDS